MGTIFRTDTYHHVIRRGISLILVAIMLFSLAACGAAEKAEQVKDQAVEKAGEVKDHVVEKAEVVKEQVIEKASEWYESIDLEMFKRGWDHAVDYVSTAYSTVVGSQYVQKVGNAINDLKTSINSAKGSARGVQQEAGFAAEKWTAGTFNIDAAARGSNESASVVGSNKLGSVDVTTSYGENASSKFYQTANDSARAQATSIIKAYNEYKAKSPDPMSLEDYLNKNGYDAKTQDALLASIYEGQTRIIPADQYDDAVKYLQGKISKLKPIGGNVTDAQAKAYQETLDNLKDRLEAPDGTHSKPASYEEMQAIAELSQKGEFKPEDFGITTASVITPKYIIKQAIGAGASSAVIQAVLTIGPDIFSIVSEAYKTGAFDEEALKETGIDGLLAGSEGFVEGSVSCALVASCEAGKLGSNLKNVSPNIIGALTVLVVEAIRYGYYLSKGDITASDYSNLIAENIIVSAGSLGGGALLGLFLPLTPIAYLAGSLAGGMAASIGYNIVKEIVLEIKDGDGFGVVVPAKILDSISVAKDTIASLNIVDKITSFKDIAVSTMSDGYIKIKEAF